MAGIDHFLTSKRAAPDRGAAAIIVLEDGRYVPQLRDDIPPIWYSGHRGLFGGYVGEDAVETLRRELLEELELEISDAQLLVRFDFDLTPIAPSNTTVPTTRRR